MWQDILSENHQNADAREGFASAYLRGKQLDKASEAIDQCIAVDPGRSYLLLDLARHHCFAKQYGKAEEIIQQYLVTDPPPCLPMQAHATFVLARVKHINGDRQAAKDLIGQARELDDSLWPSMSRPSQRLFVAP